MVLTRVNIFMIGYGASTAMACVLMIVAIGAPRWVEVGSLHAGLFKDQGRCIPYSDYENGADDLTYVDFVAGLCITAILLYGLTVLIMGHLLFFQEMHALDRTHGYLTLSVSIVADILALGGVGYFVQRLKDDMDSTRTDWNFGYCPYIAGISTVFITIAGISSVMTLQAVVTRPMLSPPPNMIYNIEKDCVIQQTPAYYQPQENKQYQQYQQEKPQQQQTNTATDVISQTADDTYVSIM